MDSDLINTSPFPVFPFFFLYHKYALHMIKRYKNIIHQIFDNRSSDVDCHREGSLGGLLPWLVHGVRSKGLSRCWLCWGLRG